MEPGWFQILLIGIIILFAIGPKWFCAVRIDKGVLVKSGSLEVARAMLGKGSGENRQAIIPMTGNKAGDPHTLDKSWDGGSMWWRDWHDINEMRDMCTGDLNFIFYSFNFRMLSSTLKGFRAFQSCPETFSGTQDTGCVMIFWRISARNLPFSSSNILRTNPFLSNNVTKPTI